MASKVIKFSKSGATSMSFYLDDAKKLDVIRTELESAEDQNFMITSDLFLGSGGGSEIPKSQESLIALSEIIGDDNTVHIGSVKVDDPLEVDDGVQHYNTMSSAEKASLFEKVEILNGLTFDDKNAFGRTFKKVCVWKNNNPEAKRPSPLTQVNTTDAFSETTHSLVTSNVQSGSVSVTTPYGGGEAEFKVEKKKSTSSKEVTQYITSKFVVRKVQINIETSDFQVSSDFENEIATAVDVDSGKEEFNQYYNLLVALNKYGYYVAQTFALGGAILSSDSSTISEYSESETNNEEYGGSFKLAFDGIGGGASYKNASGSTETTTSTDKFKITSLDQIGGKAGTSNDYEAWSVSLDKAVYWDVASYDKLYPTVVLLTNVQVQNKCIKLMNKFSSYPNAVALQPNMDMLGYATAAESIIMGDSTPWGN